MVRVFLARASGPAGRQLMGGEEDGRDDGDGPGQRQEDRGPQEPEEPGGVTAWTAGGSHGPDSGRSRCLEGRVRCRLPNSVRHCSMSPSRPALHAWPAGYGKDT